MVTIKEILIVVGGERWMETSPDCFELDQTIKLVHRPTGQIVNAHMVMGSNAEFPQTVWLTSYDKPVAIQDFDLFGLVRIFREGAD